ncbi:hypothetical protein [Planktothrix sp. FACHB-1355]|uniref:hypothetical protein n=1 Tax=Planktothrix sp. FACHB-1355 TaxID=2692854 RepID=UPI003221D03C
MLITGAIALEIWHIYAVLTHTEIPNSLNPIFAIERFAVVAHFVEGVIAAFYAASKNKTPLEYGIYTFFVGTVGLLELFDKFEKVD